MLPIQNMDLEHIYLRSLGKGMRSIAVTSSNSGEGVSSLAVALAQRHLLSGKSTLFVELGSDQPGHLSLMTPQSETDLVASTEPQLLTDREESYALLGISAPRNNMANLKWRNPGMLEAHIGSWLEQFDSVIIDAGCFNRQAPTLVPAERVVGACEATLLMVMAGVTGVPAVRNTCDRIAASGGKLAGCVLNERYNPSLKQELLRETARLPDALGKLKNYINQWLDRNRLLSLDI